MRSLVLFLGFLPWTTFSAGGGSSSQLKLSVKNSTDSSACITLWAQIDLDLSYYTNPNDAQATAKTITVPAGSTVNKNGSTCQRSVIDANGVPINSQIMKIDFYHMPGWSMTLYFTHDKTFWTDQGKQWALYNVELEADYTTLPTIFPNAAGNNGTYKKPVQLNGDNEFADYIFATYPTHYLNCPSKQKYAINDNLANGPLGYVTFSLLSVQSYIESTSSSFTVKNRETCPTDQHTTDKVPIIVGGSLAGLIVLTMALYLVYRACLPQEIIQMTNPHSHHENKAMTWDEEETSSSHYS